MNLDLAKKELSKNGYAKIESVFTLEEVNRIRDEAYKCLIHKDRLQLVGDKPALLFWPKDINDYLKEITYSDKLSKIVKYFLGDHVRHLNNQIYYRESGDGDEFAWHQDICFRTPKEDFNNIEANYLQIIIVVDGMDEANGAIEFIPGSHKWGNLNLIPRDNSERGLRKFERNGRVGVKVKASPGDVLIWSVMTVHGSEKNNSNRNRMNFMNGFASEEAIINKERFEKYAAL